MPKLPPRLDKNFFLAMYKHSKGAQGLSVQLQIIRICTDISISLSIWQRQWGSRYTIHAGRNLPDKEFRYLWTVRVTAAVYWELGSKPRLFPLILQHRAGVSPYTSSYELAGTCVFGKQSLPPIMCQLKKISLLFCKQPINYSLSRSYRAILPSSFTILISNAFVY